MATFVLVPGAYNGSWWYEPLVRALRADGHRAEPVTLTGLERGDRATRQGTNLATHIDDVCRLFDSADLSGVVLCAHSYGGMVITGVADRIPDRIAALVYLDALVPRDGDSVWSLMTDEFRALHLESAQGEGYEFAPLPHLEPRDLVSPHPAATFFQALRLTGAHERVPSRTLVYCTRFRGTTLTPTYERLRTLPEWNVLTLDADHDVMVEAPQDVFDIVTKVAAGGLCSERWFRPDTPG